MPLLRVVAEDHVEPGILGVTPQPHRLGWWILPVVVKVDDVGATRMPPAGEHRIVLAVVPRMLNERDRHLRVADERAAHLAGRIATAVVDQNDFVPALDRERLDFAHHRADGLAAAVERNHEAERSGRHR